MFFILLTLPLLVSMVLMFQWFCCLGVDEEGLCSHVGLQSAAPCLQEPAWSSEALWASLRSLAPPGLFLLCQHDFCHLSCFCCEAAQNSESRSCKDQDTWRSCLIFHRTPHLVLALLTLLSLTETRVTVDL